MSKAKGSPLVKSVERLIGKSSMPEVVAALVKVSRSYKSQLQQEGNREYMGWKIWESALLKALRQGADPEEAAELTED